MAKQRLVDPAKMREMGKKGGTTTKKRYGRKYYVALAGQRKHFRGGRKPHPGRELVREIKASEKAEKDGL